METDLPKLLAGEFTKLDAVRQKIAALRQQLDDGDWGFQGEELITTT